MGFFAGFLSWDFHLHLMGCEHSEVISGWWLKNHLEKSWSSSMGRMTSHLYEMVNVPNV